MQQYKDLMVKIIETGDRQSNRTGIDTFFMFDQHMSFDLTHGFPIGSIRKVPFISPIAEMAGFLKGARNSKEFRDLGCKYWDQNANEDGVDMAGNVVPNAWLTNPFRTGEDDMGDVYGHQWTAWPGTKVINYDHPNYKNICAKLLSNGWLELASRILGEGSSAQRFVIFYKEINQIQTVVKEILTNPTNRRILFHAWNPAALDQMSLVPCHLLYQFVVNTTRKELNLSLVIRSNDFILGNPSNVVGAGFLLELMARLTGYKARHLGVTMTDCHIYENHLDGCREMLDREPRPLPKLIISDEVPKFEDGLTLESIMQYLSNIDPSHFKLEGYDPHPKLESPLPMAV